MPLAEPLPRPTSPEPHALHRALTLLVDVLTRSGVIITGDSLSPSAHATTHEPGGSDPMAVDAAAGTGSLRTLGTGAQQATAGNDSRLSDARTPTAHKTSHETGGSDALTGSLDANARVAVRKNSGVPIGTRRRLNLIEGSGVTLTVADDGVSEEIDITVAAAAADPSYSPGSFTIATETGRYIPNHLKLTTTQRVTLQGTSRLVLTN